MKQSTNEQKSAYISSQERTPSQESLSKAQTEPNKLPGISHTRQLVSRTVSKEESFQGQTLEQSKCDGTRNALTTCQSQQQTCESA